MAGRDFQETRNGLGLVVGGDSLVGSAIHAYCRKSGIAVEISSRRPRANGLFLDLRDPDFAPLARASYGFAFLCAAVTDMRACQEDPALTRQVNVANTIELMRRLADRGTHLVFLSSSQVFDGETANPAEDAATCPKNEYGAQKLAVEQAIERHELPAAILRPTKILASHPVGVFKAWFEALAKGEAIQAATNMALSPVMVDDVARAAGLLAGGRHRGIWHLGANDEMTYFEAARRGPDRCPGAGDLSPPPYDAVEPEDRTDAGYAFETRPGCPRHAVRPLPARGRCIGRRVSRG
jgi:dTDP-4-dehydrorhamnose reductase